MGLLNQNNKKGDKKSGSKAGKATGPAQSKFIPKGTKASGGPVMKKTMTGGSQRGS
jgi:hypothetical protein